jgi:hypothetical protein
MVQRCGGSTYEQGRVGEERGSKETDGYPLTATLSPLTESVMAACNQQRVKLYTGLRNACYEQPDNIQDSMAWWGTVLKVHTVAAWGGTCPDSSPLWM